MNRESRNEIYRKAGVLHTLEAKEGALESIINIAYFGSPPYSAKLFYSETQLVSLELTPTIRDYFVEELKRQILELRSQLGGEDNE